VKLLLDQNLSDRIISPISDLFPESERGTGQISEVLITAGTSTKNVNRLA